MTTKRKSGTPGATAATVGYEAQLWQMADALRGSMDAAEYKHVCLGLLFLKYISDAFEEKHAALLAEKAQGADPEDPDEYRAQGIFWVPPEARWPHLKAQARQSTIGQLVDDAMAGIEHENEVSVQANVSGAHVKPRSGGRSHNPALKGVLPKEYARPALDKLLVEMLEPYRGRAYDPCCGSSGMFVQSVEFIRAHAKGNGHGGNSGAKARVDISIYGQESNYTTWRLARMNLAIRGIDSGQIAQGDTFHNDRHPDLKADFILANPPFNISDWGGERLQGDKRWHYGAPPAGNANFAWVQHIVHHLAPAGVAGFVLAHGSMSSDTLREQGTNDDR